MLCIFVHVVFFNFFVPLPFLTFKFSGRDLEIRNSNNKYDMVSSHLDACQCKL